MSAPSAVADGVEELLVAPPPEAAAYLTLLALNGPHEPLAPKGPLRPVDGTGANVVWINVGA